METSNAKFGLGLYTVGLLKVYYGKAMCVLMAVCMKDKLCTLWNEMGREMYGEEKRRKFQSIYLAL